MAGEPFQVIYESNVQSLTITPFSQYQNKLLYKLEACLQQDIRQAIFDQMGPLGHIAFTPDEVSERVRHRTVPLSQLETNKGHRRRAIAELEKMSQMSIYVPVMKGKATTYNCFPRLFAVSFETQGKRLVAKLDFSTDLLYYLLNTSMGYHKLNLTELLSFKRNATRQMYRLYYGFFAHADLKQMKALRLGTLLSQQMEFPNCSYILKNVVQPAHDELRNAFYAGRSPFHFDYELAKPGGQEDTVSNDELASVQKTIVITIYTREDENPTGDRKLELDEYQARLRTTLRLLWGVEEKVAIDISQKVKFWMRDSLDALMAHKRWFAEKMRAKRTPIANEAGYIVKHIGKFFDEKLKMKQKMDSEGARKYPNDPTLPIL